MRGEERRGERGGATVSRTGTTGKKEKGWMDLF
jgi:hypothetical protein